MYERYKLEKNKPKGRCPHCSKVGKWRYFEGFHGDSRYGICDRINHCPSQGQIYYPDKKEVPQPIIRQDTQAKKTQLFLNHIDVQNYLKVADTYFHKFCHSLGISREHLSKWNIGGDGVKTVFIFQNNNMQYINRKIGMYDINGKRNKDFGFYSMKHTDKGFYALCLFGEHLMTDKKVYIVESEKTAVIASWFYPHYDWVACGSSSGLSDGTDDTNDKITVLKGKQVIWMCDGDKAGRDNSSIRNLQKHRINYNIKDLFSSRDDGYDIADKIIDSKENNFVNLLKI